MSNSILLGVNIDHVATLRQARHTLYPDPILAAKIAESAGADSITIHLREDRRHIQEHDLAILSQNAQARLNLECAVTEEMLQFIAHYKPAYCCFVPEKREELTTEGGLDVIKNFSRIQEACERAQNAGTMVSLFIDPHREQIEAAIKTGAPVIELHTGEYAETQNEAQQQALETIITSARFAHSKGLIVNAGHGLNYENVQAIAAIPEIHELNIGHAIVAQALFDGFYQAVYWMKQLMLRARTA